MLLFLGFVLEPHFLSVPLHDPEDHGQSWSNPVNKYQIVVIVRCKCEVMLLDYNVQMVLNLILTILVRSV